MSRVWLAVLVLVACGDDVQPPQGEPGHFTIGGTARYEDRPQQANGHLGQAAPKVARGVLVSVIAEDDGAVLGMVVAGDDGRFSIEVDGNTGEKVHVLLAATSTVATRPIDVKAPGGKIHGFGGATFPLADNAAADVLVTVVSKEAEAFNIFDTLIDVMDQIPTLLPGKTQQHLTGLWSDGNQDGTYYAASELHLLGDASDSDGFDDTVILHESGHWIEDIYGRSDSPGGDHDGSPTDPTLAWSEGFSTYFSMAITNQPIYGDSNAQGGFSYNGDTSVTKANPAGAIGQNVSEDMVTEILWDMADAPPSDDDGVTTGNHAMVVGLEAFLRVQPLRNVGKPGVDLVDALDEWFLQNGQSTCAGMRGIIDTKHTFPYDYGFNGGPCP
jgi:hypothetical protein